MIMEARAKRLSTPLQWGRREKTAVAALLTTVLLAAVALGAYALTSGSARRADCVDVNFPSTLGGAELKGCGAKARRICASGSFRAIGEQLRGECRRAGFVYVAARPTAARSPKP